MGSLKEVKRFCRYSMLHCSLHACRKGAFYDCMYVRLKAVSVCVCVCVCVCMLAANLCSSSDANIMINIALILRTYTFVQMSGCLWKILEIGLTVGNQESKCDKNANCVAVYAVTGVKQR
jgi:hypothetical protein